AERRCDIVRRTLGEHCRVSPVFATRWDPWDMDYSTAGALADDIVAILATGDPQGEVAGVLDVLGDRLRNAPGQRELITIGVLEDVLGALRRQGVLSLDDFEKCLGPETLEAWQDIVRWHSPADPE